MKLQDSSQHPKIYICHSGHDHDRIYTENLIEYLAGQGVRCKIVELNPSGLRPELEQCLDDEPVAVLGYNSQLDHSWLSSGSFMAAAKSRNVPVIQWILDHPSSRWMEFNASTSANSRFLLNSRYSEQYFLQYCMPGAETAIMGGVGPSHRAHVAALSRDSFLRRPILCMIPLSLKRVGGTIEETQAAIAALEGPLAAAVNEAASSARFDLTRPLEIHLVAALGKSALAIDDRIFNSCFWLVEDSVQSFRRLKIFEIARRHPVLIQSDPSAVAFIQCSAATCLVNVNVGMQETLLRMPQCRAVMSVSPLNDMIHDRTMNALNAGCVAIVEDNIAHRGILQHGKNALLFRYEDDSLHECLDIVCNQPERSYAIADAGMRLRSDPRFGFGEFHNVIELARRPAAILQQMKSPT
jgi:hypothetical protein